MGVLTTYTLRSLKKSPVRTAATALGVVLATALILAVITSAVSLYHYLVDVEEAKSGSYNGTVIGATAEEVARVEGAVGVTRCAAVELEGYALGGEGSQVPYVAIEGLVPGVGTDRDFAELVSLNLVEGAFPASPDEILLPHTLKLSGTIDVAVGDEVTFEVGTRVDAQTGAPLVGDSLLWGDYERFELGEELVETAPRRFTVCGYYADNNPLFYQDGYSSTVAGFPALTMAGTLDDAPADASYQLWASVEDPAMTGVLLDGLVDSDRAEIRLNDFINRITSVSLTVGGYRTLITFAGLVLILVVASSLLLIRNSFAISVSERTRQFGLLSSVGATRRQLRSMVMREVLVVSAVAIPMGLAVGVVGTAAVLYLCSDLVGDWASTLVSEASREVPLRIVVSPGAVAFAAVLALLTTMLSAWGPARRASRMSAIDAIRSSADVRVPAGVVRSGRVAGRLFGVEGSIAAKSFRRARKPRRATVAALVTGVVLVVSATLLGSYTSSFLGAAVPEAERSYDLRYWFYDGSIDGEATPGQAMDEIGGAEGVAQAVDGMSLPVRGDLADPAVAAGLSEQFEDVFGNVQAMNFSLLFVDDDVFRGWAAEAGLDAGRYFDTAHPRMVGIDVLNVNDGERYGRIKPFAGVPFVFEGKTEVPPTSGLDDGAMVGDGPSGVADDQGEEADEGFVANGWHGISVEVDGFVNEAPWWVGTPSLPVLVAPYSALGAVDPTLVPGASDGHYLSRSYFVHMRSDDPVAAEKAVAAELRLLGLSPTRLYNLTTASAGSVGLLKTAQTFIWAFAVIVTLIAVTSAFNTMYTSVGLRRREFAVLRSVGLTRRGLYKMLGCECLMYGVRVLLWSIPPALLVSLALCSAVGQSVSTTGLMIPWAVVPASLGAFAVVALATAYAVHKVDAGSPVEALRSELA